MGSIKEKLLSFIPATLILALTIIFSQIFFQNLVDTETEKSWNDLVISRNDTTHVVAESFKTNGKILDLTSEAIVLNADLEDEETVLTYLQRVQSETLFDRVDVVYPNGEILVSSTGLRIPDNGEKTFLELIEIGSHVSPRVWDYVDSSKQAIHFFSPVYDQNRAPVAILCATVYCSTLADNFSCGHYSESAQIFLVDRRDGSIVLDKWRTPLGNVSDLRENQLCEGYEDADPVTEILEGKEGKVSFISNVNGKVIYMTYEKVEGTDFTLGVVIQEEFIFAEVNQIRKTVAWVGFIEILLLIIFALWIYFIFRSFMSSKAKNQEEELELLLKKEEEIQTQFTAAEDRKKFLESMAQNLPGGYHRCTTDYSFRLTFVSNSFTQVTGYGMAEAEAELGGSYMGIVAEEDRAYFMSLAPQLEKEGAIHCSYRIRRRDGSIRWVKDTTQYIERGGEQYYQCALMDITEQIEEINEARKLAEASSQAKSTFLFNISHDIRTPMNAIKGFTNIIEDNKEDSKIVGETIVKIKQASNTLMTLMNDVLDLSRIEKGKEELNLEPVDMNEQGKGLFEMFASEMEEAGVDFTVEKNITNPYVMCDALKLVRVQMNMLSNAKKFTKRGGKVVFGVEELSSDGEKVLYRFYAKDTGVGMSEEFLKKAFDQFEREYSSTETRVAGSGLGLAIIKKFTEIMGGTVELKSQLGKGTTVSVTIPFHLVKKQEDRAEKKVLELPDIKGKKVLLVEDNEFNREIARYILEGMELDVEEAENGAVCIERLIQKGGGYYDLILMDVQMPVMDGYVATAEIRSMKDKALSEIPIIAMTANAFEEDKKKCLDVGMNGHVGKPIDMEDLVKALVEVF